LNGAIAGEHFGNGGRVARLVKNVPYSSHDAFGRSMVDQRINALMSLVDRCAR
jgi:hypothetical protein